MLPELTRTETTLVPCRHLRHLGQMQHVLEVRPTPGTVSPRITLSTLGSTRLGRFRPTVRRWLSLRFPFIRVAQYREGQFLKPGRRLQLTRVTPHPTLVRLILEATSLFSVIQASRRLGLLVARVLVGRVALRLVGVVARLRRILVVLVVGSLARLLVVNVGTVSSISVVVVVRKSVNPPLPTATFLPRNDRIRVV